MTTVTPAQIMSYLDTWQEIGRYVGRGGTVRLATRAGVLQVRVKIDTEACGPAYSVFYEGPSPDRAADEFQRGVACCCAVADERETHA